MSRVDGELHRAAAAGDAQRLAAALEEHPEQLSAPNRRGMAPLHIAADAGHEACVRALLSTGADAAAVEGDTHGAPLHLAAGGGHEGCVQALLQSRAQVDARDGDGWTPLAHAAYYGEGSGGANKYCGRQSWSVAQLPVPNMGCHATLRHPALD